MQFQHFGSIFYNQGLLFWLGLAVIPLLTPINWLFEAMKWNTLTRHIQDHSMKDSYHSVLAGIAFGFVTPRAVGDYFGRMLTFNHKNKPLVVVPLILGRVAQIIPTLFFGVIGILVISMQVNIQTLWYVIPAFLFFGSLIFLLGFNGLKKYLYSLMQHLGWLEAKTNGLKLRDILHVIKLSFLRYVVFSSQFLIAMIVFGVEANFFIMMAGITWIFFAKSIIPSFSFLSDLGIREFSAILFFEAFQVPLVPVLAASLFIWLINIAIPSIIGLLSVQRAKI